MLLFIVILDVFLKICYTSNAVTQYGILQLYIVNKGKYNLILLSLNEYNISEWI